MPSITAPAAVAAASACYCFPEDRYRGAVLYLLLQTSGLILTPKQLAENSACFCFDKKAFQAAELYLLNTIANK
jgi:hypothetical protein